MSSSTQTQQASAKQLSWIERLKIGPVLLASCLFIFFIALSEAAQSL